MFNWKKTIEKYKEEIALLNKYANKSAIGNYTKGSIRNCEAHVLYSIIQDKKYKNILEIGTGNGFGTLCFSLAVSRGKEKGTVDTIDIIDKKAEKKLDVLLEKFDTEQLVKFHIGDSSDVIPKLDPINAIVSYSGPTKDTPSNNPFFIEDLFQHAITQL